MYYLLLYNTRLFSPNCGAYAGRRYWATIHLHFEWEWFIDIPIILRSSNGIVFILSAALRRKGSIIVLAVFSLLLQIHHRRWRFCGPNLVLIGGRRFSRLKPPIHPPQSPMCGKRARERSIFRKERVITQKGKYIREDYLLKGRSLYHQLLVPHSFGDSLNERLTRYSSFELPYYHLSESSNDNFIDFSLSLSWWGGSSPKHYIRELCDNIFLSSWPKYAEEDKT